MSVIEKSPHSRDLKLNEELGLTAKNKDSGETSQPNDNGQEKSDSGCEAGAEFEKLNVNGSYELHKLIKVPEDASSLFNSLSYLVYGDTSQGSLVRFFIVEHIGNNWMNFKNYATSPEGKMKYSTKEEYMAEMMESTTRGGGCELIAAGSIFPYCFEVYVNGTRYTIYGDSKKPIRRLRSSGEVEKHYDAYEFNEEVSMTVNKNIDKAMKRKMDCLENKSPKSPTKKVWKKKLKIEENLFATVWLDNGSGGTSEAKNVISKANEVFQREIEKCSVNETEEMDVGEGSLVTDENLLAVDGKTQNLGVKRKRGRPKKHKTFPEFYDRENNGNNEEEEELLEENSEKSNDDEKVKSDKIPWMISLKKKSVGRPRKNSLNLLDKGRVMCKIHVPKNSLILSSGKKPRGRPRKILLESENLENSVANFSDESILDNFEIKKKFKVSNLNLEEGEKKRGRPRIHPKVEDSIKKPRGRPRIHPKVEDSVKKPRGRPRIHPKEEDSFKKPRGRPRVHPKSEEKVKKPRGRPRKEQFYDENLGSDLGSDPDHTEKAPDESEVSSEIKTELNLAQKKRGRPRKVIEPEEGFEMAIQTSDPEAIENSEDVLEKTVSSSEEQPESSMILLPQPELNKSINKMKKKKKRGRPKKENPVSDWDSFVTPLLNQKIIPLPFPGFTNPSDMPSRPQGRPKKFILNEDDEKPVEQKIARPRGRPRKERPALDSTENSGDKTNVDEETEINNSASDWSSFVEPLLVKSIIPLPLPGFTKPSDIPIKPPVKIKRGRGRPRKVLPVSENCSAESFQSNSEGNLEQVHSSLLESRDTSEVVKRPRGRPPKRKRSSSSMQTVEIVEKAIKLLENELCDQKNSNELIESKSSIPRIKIKLLSNSIYQSEESSLPGTSKIIKKPRGRPRNRTPSPPSPPSINENSNEVIERNDTPSPENHE